VSRTTLHRHTRGRCVFGFVDGHAKSLSAYAQDSIYFPPAESDSPSHRDARTKELLGPDPAGDMTFQGKQYGATFHLN